MRFWYVNQARNRIGEDTEKQQNGKTYSEKWEISHLCLYVLVYGNEMGFAVIFDIIFCTPQKKKKEESEEEEEQKDELAKKDFEELNELEVSQIGFIVYCPGMAHIFGMWVVYVQTGRRIF